MRQFSGGGRKRRGVFGLFICTMLLAVGFAAGCGGDNAPNIAEPITTIGFPHTIENCGKNVTFTAPPQRVVAIKSPPVEMMLALGVGDRLIGVAGLDGPVPAWLSNAAANTVVDAPMTTGVPGTESVLALDPDLVYAGWESNLTANGAGTRELFDNLDIATYVSPAACRSTRDLAPLTFDDIWAEITQAGEIFDVPNAAFDLVADQQSHLAAVLRDPRNLTALWWSSARDTPYVGAGLGAPQLIMDRVGLTNIAGDIQDTWSALSWEQVITEDPDVIVLVDAEWNTAAAKREYLEGNPATSQLTAVREGRVLIVPFPASEAGVRTVSAVEDLAAQLGRISL